MKKRKAILTALAAVTAGGLVLSAVFSFTSTARSAMTESVSRRYLASGSEYVQNGLMFTELEDGTYEVGYNYNGAKPAGTVKIPETVNGRRVTRIAEAGFYGCDKLTNVVVPDSVTGAGANAFTGTPFLNSQSGTVKYAGRIAVYCAENAMNVAIKDGTVGLADRLFTLAEELRTVTLPESLVNIGSMTFDGCEKLTAVNIPSGVTAIGSGAFRGCAALSSVTIPSGVTAVGSYAFADSGITAANLENTVKIGKGAFEGSDLGVNSVRLGGGFVEIGGRAFADTAFYSALGQEKYLGSVFIGCGKDAVNVTIREGTSAIADMAFAGCKSLKSVTIPSSVRTIGEDAFFNCPKLAAVTIPEGVESIGEDAFRLCSGLTSVSLPMSLRDAGGGAFYGCDKVETVTYPGSVSDMAEIEGGDGFALPYASTVKLGGGSEAVSPVSGLKVTAVSHDSAALGWSGTSLATGYRVEVYKDGKWRFAGWTDGTSYTVTGLSQCSGYDFRVYACVHSVLSAATTVSAQTKLGPVTGVKTAPTDHEITLTWEKNDFADSYQIDMYKDGAWTYLAKTADTEYTAEGLETKSEYLFRIYSLKGSEFSASATAVATASDPNELRAVTGLMTSTYTDSIKLMWSGVSVADSYQVDVFKDGEWTFVARTKDTSYTVTGLEPNTSYRFKVYAFRDSEYSPSASITASTRETAYANKPSAVTGLSAAPTSDSITLSWNGSASADSYQIDMFKNGEWTYLAKISGTSYTVAGLSENTGYQFKVFAFSGSEHSSSVSISTATKASAADKPAAVTGLSASSKSDSITLSWNGNADSYQVDVFKNGEWTYVGKTSWTSYTVASLAADTSYEFRVFAFKEGRYSPSVKIAVSTLSSRPDEVTGLSALSGTGSISLYWDKSDGADSYQVDMFKNGGWTYLAKVTGTSYTVNDLYADTEYRFRVFAFKDGRNSPSVSINVSTSLTAGSWGKPAAVTGLSAVRGSSSVTLSWNRSTFADSYQIDMFKDGEWTYIANITENSYTVTGLELNESYRFRVFAFRDGQYSSSTSITASTAAVLAPTPRVLAPPDNGVTGLSGEYTMLRGIDVSGWQGEIDFNAVKESGVDYVIIKAGGSYSTVPTWEINYENARKAGLKVGAYWYSYAVTIEEGRQEAKAFAQAMRGKQFDFPVYFDIEESEQFDKGVKFCTELIDTFCGELEKAGYYTGVYCSTVWFTRCVSESARLCRPAWIADYRGCCYYSAAYGAWQYGAGPVDGVEFDADLNWGYVDYSKFIRSNKLNGF